MKKVLIAATLLLPFLGVAQINVGGTINDKANEKTGQAIDAVWNAPGKAKDKKKEKEQSSGNSSSENSSSENSTENSSSGNTATTTTTQTTNIKAYQNYDFVAGTELVFFDDFMTDMDGEFPAHWDLDNGQGVVNKIDNKPAFFLTDGNYVRVLPRVTPNTYLNPDAWTVEADWIPQGGDYGLRFFFFSGDREVMDVQPDGVSFTCTFPATSDPDGDGQKSLEGSYSSEQEASYPDHWHHVAIAYKNGQVKIYLDQSRILVVPNCNCKPTSIMLGGIGQQDHPIKFTNVRIANGGNQNMLNALNTNGKIVSYGITFDVNKADIKPESMGTLNEIAKMMKDNPAIKLEIGGHCDSDGDDASNLKLSQARAEAVRNQLISMGIDGSRLTAKGYGETKPIAPNTTFEGKTKNRRVEFTKL